MLGQKLAKAIVTNLRELFPEPVSCQNVRTGFSRAGMYCVAGSLAQACDLSGVYGRFPQPYDFERLLRYLGVPESYARMASRELPYHNDARQFETAYDVLADTLAEADEAIAREVIPHSLWPLCSLDEVLAATEAARGRQEVVLELVQVLSK